MLQCEEEVDDDDEGGGGLFLLLDDDDDDEEPELPLSHNACLRRGDENWGWGAGDREGDIEEVKPPPLLLLPEEIDVETANEAGEEAVRKWWLWW